MKLALGRPVKACQNMNANFNMNDGYLAAKTALNILSLEVADLRRSIKKLCGSYSYGRIASIFINRLEIELNKHGFFNTDERQLANYSMADYHIMFIRHQRQNEGDEKFTRPQAQAYAMFLSEAFPSRFGDMAMSLEKLSLSAANLLSGVLEFAGNGVDDVSEEDVQRELDQLKQEDITGLQRPFMVQDLRDLYFGLKAVHERRMGLNVPLLSVIEIEFPQLTFVKGEFD